MQGFAYPLSLTSTPCDVHTFSCCLPRLPVFQPSQLWGVVWGLARLGHVPRATWMERWLMCSERVIGEFTIEGLCHMAWALGALGYVPEKTWLRSFIGQVSAGLYAMSVL